MARVQQGKQASFGVLTGFPKTGTEIRWGEREGASRQFGHYMGPTVRAQLGKPSLGNPIGFVEPPGLQGGDFWTVYGPTPSFWRY